MNEEGEVEVDDYETILLSNKFFMINEKPIEGVVTIPKQHTINGDKEITIYE